MARYTIERRTFAATISNAKSTNFYPKNLKLKTLLPKTYVDRQIDEDFKKYTEKLKSNKYNLPKYTDPNKDKVKPVISTPKQQKTIMFSEDDGNKTYVLRRKNFGVIEAAGNVLGNTTGGLMKGVGSAMNTKVARIGGGILGAKLLAPTVGAIFGGGPIASVLGGIGTYAAGKAVTGGIAKGIKTAGQNLMS